MRSTADNIQKKITDLQNASNHYKSEMEKNQKELDESKDLNDKQKAELENKLASNRELYTTYLKAADDLRPLINVNPVGIEEPKKTPNEESGKAQRQEPARETQLPKNKTG